MHSLHPRSLLRRFLIQRHAFDINVVDGVQSGDIHRSTSDNRARISRRFGVATFLYRAVMVVVEVVIHSSFVEIGCPSDRCLNVIDQE
jgi:hypothetical protein